MSSLELYRKFLELLSSTTTPPPSDNNNSRTLWSCLWCRVRVMLHILTEKIESFNFSGQILKTKLIKISIDLPQTKTSDSINFCQKCNTRNISSINWIINVKVNKSKTKNIENIDSWFDKIHLVPGDNNALIQKFDLFQVNILSLYNLKTSENLFDGYFQGV